MSKGPLIGVFDSGVGGLTVLKAIESQLPGFPLIYYGDTANMPYGDKSPDLICRLTRRIVRFLRDQGAEIIVIACNSASAVAADVAVEEAGPGVRVVDVVQPVVDHLAQRSDLRCIGLIGTRATIQSGIYQEKLRSLRADLEVRALATPLLAPLVEEGFAGTPVAREVIRHYLKNDLFRPIQCLVPACTHYPFLHDDFNDFFWYKVEILNPPEIVARQVKHKLKPKHQLDVPIPGNPSPDQPAIHLSMLTAGFRDLCVKFLNKKVSIQETFL